MTWSPDPNALRVRVALVAGATGGAGRGIAAALGEAGATVICTKRSTRAQGSSRCDYNRSETVEETAELVTRLGGTGIAIAVDHLESREVKRLVDDLRQTYGHINVLVNDIWGAEVLKGGPSEWNTPVWEHDPGKGLRILRLGIETSSPLTICSHCRQSGRRATRRGDRRHIRVQRRPLSGVPFYDLAKISVNRLAFSLGHELAAHAATVSMRLAGCVQR